MPDRLELSYNWQRPVGISTIAALISVGLLARSGTYGWVSVALLIGMVWVGFLGLVWLRTRAYLQVEGPILRTRRYRGINELDGRKVVRVQEYLTPSGPCYKVYLRTDGAENPSVGYVAASLLKKGHSTFFDWLQTWAPRAELDEGSRKTVERLKTRGLLE